MSTEEYGAVFFAERSLSLLRQSVQQWLKEHTDIQPLSFHYELAPMPDGTLYSVAIFYIQGGKQ